jgi:hypothetical protein
MMRHPISLSIGPIPCHPNRGCMISPKSGRPLLGEINGIAPTRVLVLKIKSTVEPS